MIGYVVYSAPAGFRRADVMTREIRSSYDLSTAIMSDDRSARERALAATASLVERLGGPHLRVERRFPNEAGQPMPRALCRVLGEGAASRRDDMVALLRSGDPSVEVGVTDADADSFYVNPMTVDPDEADALLARLCAVVEAVEGVAV